MSGLNNDDDEALDNVDSLISRIKGNKKNEEAQVPKNTESPPLKASPGGWHSASRIGDFDALRKKLDTSKTEDPAPQRRESQSNPSHNRLHHSMMIWNFLMQTICRKNPPDPSRSHKSPLPNLMTSYGGKGCTAVSW